MTDLKLDSDDELPRRLLAFPDGQLLAYGGDDGNLTCIDTTNKNKNIVRVHTVRQFDEAAVRAVAVSMDGQRVAVGFDNGSTRLFQYDEYEFTDKTQTHPFVPLKSKSNGNGTDNDDSDDDDDNSFGANAFMSQADLGDDDDDEEGRSWAGPQMEGPIRDLTFLPKSHLLAISSESGLCVVDVASADTMADRFLQTQVEQVHDACGIRGVSVSNDRHQLLASLAMDGRLCVWKASGLDKLGSPNDKVPVCRDDNQCILLKDIGETMDADASSRSCIPSFVQPNILALPGKVHLQLRSVSLLNETIMVEESEQEVNSDPSKGHIESIVALASAGEHIVTSGRDGRVILWKLDQDDDDLPTATFVQLLGEYKSVPTSLYWNTTNNVLYIARADAKLEMVQNMHKKAQTKKSSERVAKATEAKPVDTTNRDTTISVLESATAKESSEEKPKSRIMFDDSDSEDDEETTKPSETVPSPTAREPKSATLLNSDDEGNKESTICSSPTTKSAEQPAAAQKDAAKEDSDDDDDDLAGPETQARPTKSTATAGMDSDDAISISKSPTKDSSRLSDDMDEAKEQDSPSKSIGSDDEEEFSLKGASPEATKEITKVPVTARLPAEQLKSTQVNSDDDDIFDDTPYDNLSKPTAAKNAFIEDEAEDANEDDEAPTKATAVSPVANLGTSPTKKGLTQDENNQSESAHNDNGFANYDNDDSDDDNSMANGVAEFKKNYQQGGHLPHTSYGVVLPEPQAAFAPSATPLDLQRRYMCWNNIGSITTFRAEQLGSKFKVDINFTDSAFKRPITFTDNDGFILGSLGDDGAFFATDLAHDDDDTDDEDDMLEGLSLSAQTKAALKKGQKQRMRKSSSGRKPTGATLYFHRFETFGSLREQHWTLTLPDGERALGCASGQGWAAAITSRKFLRLFTSGGAQGQILWLPGNPVTVVGRNRFLAVFYHESTPLPDGTQQLGYMLYDAVSNQTVTKGSVSCISSGSSLSWAGFSDACSLMAMDSDGMLSMLSATSVMGNAEDNDPQDFVQPTSWEWAPMLDVVGLRKSSEDNFWPVTIYNSKLVCIPLKGGTQYPEAGRRPITSTIGLKMPLARSTGALAKNPAFEEEAVRGYMSLVQKKVNNEICDGDLLGEKFDKQYIKLCTDTDKLTLKMFAAAVRTSSVEQALDLVQRLLLEKSYEFAVKIAGRNDKLADSIEAAMDAKFGGPADDQEEFANAGEVDDGEGSYDGRNYEHSSSPLNSRQLSSQNVSPESGQGFKSKRSLQGDAFGRNVRPKAY